jgi:endonuclease/exonuclease/phosphatase family metal-dependent hydrolase
MDTLKILQWNVLYQEKSENIVKFIENTKPDIFCGQELTINGPGNPTTDIPAMIAKEGGYESFYHSFTANFSGYDSPFEYGDGIFSKFPIKEKRKFKLQEKEKYGEDRYYIEADILIGSQIVTVGTVHLLYTPYFKITQQRIDEAEKLFQIIANRHDKFILTGDMNATPDSSIIKRLEEMFIHADPNTDRATWTTKPFSYQGFEANSRDWRLDYIFATEDINVVNNKIIETNYSDHLPILTEIQI